MGEEPIPYLVVLNLLDSDILCYMKLKLRSIIGKIYSAYSLRIVFFASLSALSAYSFATAFSDFVSPTIAAIISLTAIKTNISDTVRETFKQVGGSFFGAILGILVISSLGFNGLSIILAVVLSMILSFSIRLGIPGGLAIAATVILVSGPLFADYQSIEQRVAGVIVGSLFAFLSSLLMLPWKPEISIMKKVVSYGDKTTKIMDEIVSIYRTNEKITDEQLETWLDDINTNIHELRSLTRDANQLYLDARWTPFITAIAAENIKRQAEIGKINASATRTIIYAMENSHFHQATLEDSVAKRLSSLLEASSAAMKQHLVTAMIKPDDILTEKVADDIRAKRAKLAAAMTKMDDTRAIMLSGTIMHEATKIKDIITEVNK
jgi:uncharacterized membrane protein YgaE (UPF0421/DUF939 family)